MSSYANTSSSGSYRPSTVAGNYVDSGMKSITDLMNKYKDNETIAGLGAGTIFDVGKTQVNTGSAIAYNDAFLGSMANYQSGLENIKTANAGKLMAQEGAIARDITDLQTGRALEGVKVTAAAGLAGAKYRADSDLAGIRYGADAGLAGVRYKSDRDLEGTKYTADQTLAGTMYASDQNLAGVKYGFDSQERQIGMQGREDRATLGRKTIEEKKLRADARGAIRSQGARFYG